MFVVPGWRNGAVNEMSGSAPGGYRVQVITYPNDAPAEQFPFRVAGDVQVGVDTLNWEVNQFYDACGNQPTIIAGYSMGALVAGNVLQTQPEYRDIQGIVFSDGRRLPAFDGDPGGAEAFHGALIPGDGLRGFSQPTVTICNRLDSVCFGTPDPVATVNNYLGHHTNYAGWNVAHELGLHGWGVHKNIVFG